MTLGAPPARSAARGERILTFVRQPCFRRLVDPTADSEVVEAFGANALFDASQDDQEFEYRLLGDEARDVGQLMGLSFCESRPSTPPRRTACLKHRTRSSLSCRRCRRRVKPLTQQIG